MSDETGGGLIPISQWHTIQTAGQDGKGGVPMPFVQEIYLVGCTVAGTTHVSEIETKTAELAVGSVLSFVREPQNAYDPLAIQIYNPRNERIGYVPKANNEILARLMDAGKLLFGRVEDKHTEGKWVRVTIKVFMRDL